MLFSSFVSIQIELTVNKTELTLSELSLLLEIFKLIKVKKRQFGEVINLRTVGDND